MIKASKLSLGYQGKPVISIDKLETGGEHLLILGGSGTGKTTLLYALAGLLKPISGSINIFDTEITTLSAGELDKFRGQNIGIVFQTLHMIAAISVVDNILISPFMSGKALNKANALSLLKTLNIEDLAARKPAQISQGQAQRVAIARAAVNSPKLILADEPTSALDDESTEKVIKLLFEIAAKSDAILMVASHDSRIKKYFIKTLQLGGTK
jgi:ABC-type lipoprotein export system ATPase subunit